MIEVTIPGPPVPKKRPRFVRNGKFVRAYNSQAKQEHTFMLDFMVATLCEGMPFHGKVAIEIVFYMPRPKNHFGTGKNREKLKSTAPLIHTKKPDLDNLVKFVCDALNGVAYRDDCLIYSIKASKFYSINPRTYIRINDGNKKD